MLILAFAIIFGCSSSEINPVSPGAVPETRNIPGDKASNERFLWGEWILQFDISTLEVTATPARTAFAHYNVTNKLLPPVCDDCLTIELISFNPAQHRISAKVALKNDTSLTGYDVRCILVTNTEGLRVLNADGYTKLWDDGGDIEINPFKAFATNNLHRKFSPGEGHARICELSYSTFADLSDIAVVVDASWPTNCKEPYEIGELEQDEPLPTNGGSVEITLPVRDWQFNVSEAFVDASPIGGDVIELAYDQGYEWIGMIETTQHNLPGKYLLLAWAGSQETSLELYDYVGLNISACTEEGNENPAGANLIPVGTDSGEQVVCLYDLTDWYKFEVTEHLYGDITLTLLNDTGTVEFFLYSDPAEPYLLWAEAEFGTDAIFSTDQLEIGPGWYYLEVAFVDDDYENREYILLNYTGDSICYPDGNDSHTAALNIPLGSTSGIQYVCPDDEEDWFEIVYGGTGDEAILKLTVVNETGPAELTIYDETQAPNPSGPNIVQQQADPVVLIDLDALGISTGVYYIRLKHVGMDEDLRQLTLEYRSSQVGWGLSWGGSSHDYAYDVATDGDGNIYVSGTFSSITDFDPGPGTAERTAQGFWDTFLSKFDSTGTYQWVRTWAPDEYGTFPEVTPTGLAVDQNGNLYVCGNFNNSVDFDPTSGIDEHSSQGGFDPYVVRLDSDGNYLGASTWGGSLNHKAYDIAVENSGNIFITGFYKGLTDFDPGMGIHAETATDNMDMFLLRLDLNGDFVWVYTRGDAEDSDYGVSVALDDLGFAYLGGNSPDMHVIKVNPSGNMEWMTVWDSGAGEMYDLIVDGSYATYITGEYDILDFDPGPGIDTHWDNGYGDAFLIKLGPDASYDWGYSFGEDRYDWGVGLSVDSENNLYFTGNFYSDHIDLNPGSGEDFKNIAWDAKGAFITKLTQDGSYIWGRHWEFPDGEGDDELYGLAVDQSGNAYTTGNFQSAQVDFDPGLGTDWHSPKKGHDGFLIKVKPDGYW